MWKRRHLVDLKCWNQGLDSVPVATMSKKTYVLYTNGATEVCMINNGRRHLGFFYTSKFRGIVERYANCNHLKLSTLLISTCGLIFGLVLGQWNAKNSKASGPCKMTTIGRHLGLVSARQIFLKLTCVVNVKFIYDPLIPTAEHYHKVLNSNSSMSMSWSRTRASRVCYTLPFQYGCRHLAPYPQCSSFHRKSRMS